MNPSVPLLPALLIAVGGVVALRLACLLPGRPVPGRLRGLPGDERATAMLDFILVFPLFLMIVLMTVQMALLMNARVVVGYAAFAAARAAAVSPEEGSDEVAKRARGAAAVALLPIAPPIVKGVPIPDPRLLPLFVHGGETALLPGSETLRRWGRAGAKHLYALASTEVTLSGAAGGDRGPLKAIVEHRFFLSVPYADGVFAGLMGERFLGRPVIRIRDDVTLLNEARVVTEGEGGSRCPFF